MPQTSDQNNNPIDLRELANLINDRFDKVDQTYRELAKTSNDRFDKIDDKFDKIDDKFAQIDARFDKIDDKFVQIDARFTQIDDRFDKIDDRFDKMDQANCELLEFLGEQFDKMNAKIDTKADKADTATKEDINLVLNRIAMTNTKTDDYRAEQLQLKRQVDKHERWHFQVAEKTGVKLSSGWTARLGKGSDPFQEGSDPLKRRGNDGTTKMDFAQHWQGFWIC